MSNAPLMRGGGIYQLADRTDVASGAADVWGSWVQLIASTDRPVEALNVGWRLAPEARAVLQIGIGAAASEVDILSLTMMTELNTTTTVQLQQPLGLIPVRIPAGSRVSARVKTSQASHTHVVDLQGVLPGQLLPVGASRMELYGVTAGPLGTLVTAGVGVWVYGSWVEMVASTPNRARALAIGLSTARSGAALRVEVGVGAGGSEQPLFSSGCVPRWTDWPVGGTGTVMPLDIPAGSRLAVRAASAAGAIATDGLLHVFY